MGKGKGHIPMRTCISCGSKRPKNELIRLTLNGEDRLVKDLYLKMGGRGGYVCNKVSCEEQLLGNRRLNRIFRTDKKITVTPFR